MRGRSRRPTVLGCTGPARRRALPRLHSIVVGQWQFHPRTLGSTRPESRRPDPEGRRRSISGGGVAMAHRMTRRVWTVVYPDPRDLTGFGVAHLDNAAEAESFGAAHDAVRI